jgi:hypothetical protein
LLQREGVRAVVMHPPSRFKDVGEMTAEQVAEWLALRPNKECEAREL